MQGKSLLTALMNAVEVHHAKPEVQAAAATLLRQIAAVGGSLRAKVAAGLLPAPVRCARTLAAVVSAAVGSPPRSEARELAARRPPRAVRSDRCEGVLAAVLKALRAHRAVEGVAQRAASC